ncbi:MAG TPA: copper chaperone PCu(A)C [Lamprocystis sp. (in: g-proteobacteria)]|nr:copper chaperone PCu(A)C [Lamprocystis sp. (in: g-proteobacteria)]
MSRSLTANLLAAGLFALAAQASLAAGPTTVTVGDAYARAVPPGQPNSAVFMTLTNPSSTPRALVSAHSPAAKTVELHTHVNEGGMMQMRRIERIEVPAQGSVKLVPGGLHVMLIGLTGELAPGGEVDLTLSFDDGGKVGVKAPVRTIQAKPAAH